MVTPSSQPPALARRLSARDATLIVMGGIVGSGIFMNPAVVAQQVRSPWLILGAWVVGGLVALAGAFVYGELAARRPQVGGQYAYLREAFHPALAFGYGWALLLVIQSGGMAAVAVTFARYFRELSGLAVADGAVAALVLSLLTLINAFGVRSGSTTQNLLMVAKIAALLLLVASGLWWAGVAPVEPAAPAPSGPFFGLATAFFAALVPVLFSYGGWQTATFLAGEMRDPGRDLPKGLLWGVSAVVVLYLGVSFVCLRVLGPAGLAASTAPASDVMRAAFGEPGARLIAAGIALSTLGFLAQSMLTAPRVYYAMAQDGLFLSAVGRLHPKTQAPVVAIALQGAIAIVIALSGRYEQILNYVVSMDFVFFGLTGVALFRLRRRDQASGFEPAGGFRAWGHPLTTGAFVLISALVVINTLVRYPGNTVIGFALLALAMPVYFFWRGKKP